MKRRWIVLLLSLVLLLPVSTHAQEWTQAVLPYGALSNVAWNPHDTTEVFGVHNSSHQLFRSSDGGINFDHLVLDQLPGPFVSSHFWFHPTTAESLYIYQHTYVQDGIYLSTDFGTTWSDRTPVGFGTISEVQIARSNPNRILVWTQDEWVNHCLLSEDGGENWTDLPRLATFSVQFDPFDEDHLFRVTYAGPGEVLHSTDFGETWAPWFESLGELEGYTPLEVMPDPVRPNVLYSVWDVEMEFKLLARSDGQSIDSDSVLTQCNTASMDDNGNLVTQTVPLYSYMYTAHVSVDGGNSFHSIGEWVPASGHSDGTPNRFPQPYLNPLNPATMLIGSGRQMFISHDFGASPNAVMRGVDQTSITKIVPHAGQNLVLGAAGQLWQVGENEEPSLPSRMIFCSDVQSLTPESDTLFTAGFGFQWSFDGGLNWNIAPGTDDVGNTSSVLVLPSDPPRVLYDYNGVLHRSTDWGANFLPVPDCGLPSSSSGLNLFRNPAAPNLLWVIHNGDLYLSEDYGDQFQLEFDSGNQFIDLQMTASNGTLYLLHANGSVSRWVRGTEELDPVDVTGEWGTVLSFALRPGTGAHLFIGTTNGVYWTQNYGSSWTEVEGGFEPPVTALAFSEDGSDLFVGTRDDGFWVGTDLFEPNGVEDGSEDLPFSFALYPAWPNPSNTTVRIGYRITRGVELRIAVYDLLGREVALLDEGFRFAGRHEVVWNSHVASGTYIIRLQGNGLSQSRKVVLVR